MRAEARPRRSAHEVAGPRARAVPPGFADQDRRPQSWEGRGRCPGQPAGEAEHVCIAERSSQCALQQQIPKLSAVEIPSEKARNTWALIANVDHPSSDRFFSGHWPAGLLSSVATRVSGPGARFSDQVLQLARRVLHKREGMNLNNGEMGGSTSSGSRRFQTQS